MELSFKHQSDYDEFVCELKKLAGTHRVACAEKHKKILCTSREVLCLPMKTIRRVAKEIARNDLQGFLEFARCETFEETVILGMVICELKDLDLQVKRLGEFVKEIDCWAVCDTVCASMKVLKLSKEKGKYFDFFLKLCFSESEFVARFGIVTMLSCYLQEPFLGRILDMCRGVSNDAFYVKMAVAWLLSAAFVIDRERVTELLREKSLDKFTQNKTISKCRDSFRVSDADKEYLKSLRIV